MTITYRNGVSIAEIVVYVPCLLLSIALAVKHGIGRSAGWYFLIIFCLVRIIGPAMQLATINDMDNEKLYTGSAILNNIALSPIMLATIGLLSRLLDNIHRSTKTALNTGMFKFIELLILVGLILGIVGGVDASGNFTKTMTYVPGSLNKAGTAIFIVCWVLIAAAIVMTSFSLSHAEAGEKRLFFAVAAAMPLLLIRLVYSIGSTFTTNKSFNLLSGNVTLFLCLALIEEFIIVVIFIGVGMTLKKVDKIQHSEAALPYKQDGHRVQGQQPIQQQYQEPKKENIFLRIAKFTIFGRIVMAFMPKKEEQKVEMRHEQATGYQQRQ